MVTICTNGPENPPGEHVEGDQRTDRHLAIEHIQRAERDDAESHQPR